MIHDIIYSLNPLNSQCEESIITMKKYEEQRMFLFKRKKALFGPLGIVKFD